METFADELMHFRMRNYNNKTKNKIKPHTVEKMSWIPRSAKSTNSKLIITMANMFYNADVFLSSLTKPDTLNTNTFIYVPVFNAVAHSVIYI